MLNRRRLILCSGGLALISHDARGDAPARALASPQDRVILTITGAIDKTNRAGQADFDRAMLERLGVQNLRTWTPWTEGLIDFEGVLARRLMIAVGARGHEVLATALNDYQSVIPIRDFHEYDVLLATRIDGAPLAVRDKGPIWVVYPWSEHPELDNLVTRRKSVWQLSRLHVR